jgi:uncharacterized membrane protein YeaQ/YmgE (transglycosylase-associated protein family)
MGIAAWIVLGVVAGVLARGVVPGRERLNLAMTALLGVAGSLLGGFVASLLTAHPVTEIRLSTLVASVVGAIALLLLAGAVFARRRVVYASSRRARSGRRQPPGPGRRDHLGVAVWSGQDVSRFAHRTWPPRQGSPAERPAAGQGA